MYTRTDMAQDKESKAQSYSVRGKTYWRVRTGRTEAGNASYETFGEDKASAEAYAAKLNDRAKAKRLGELDAITKEEANDLRWAIQKLAHYGATVKEAAEWFVKTKFPEKGNKTVREVGEIYLKHRANEIKSNTFDENPCAKMPQTQARKNLPEHGTGSATLRSVQDRRQIHRSI